jgi:hypothetical protein
MAQAPDAVNVELSDEERYMLVYGLRDWGGPAHCTESLAVAMGFSGIDDLVEESERIITSSATSSAPAPSGPSSTDRATATGSAC